MLVFSCVTDTYKVIKHFHMKTRIFLLAIMLTASVFADDYLLVPEHASFTLESDYKSTIRLNGVTLSSAEGEAINI